MDSDNESINSTCSSTSSNTDDENSSECSESLDSDVTNSQISSMQSDSEEIVNGTIFNFPVQIICLEKLDNTLDSLLEDEDANITKREWKFIYFKLL